MRASSLSVLAVVLFACLISVPASQAQDDAAEIAKAREEIAATNKLFMDAWNKGDAKAHAALYTPDAQLLLAGMEPVKGRAAIEQFMTPFFKESPTVAKLNTIDLEIFGDTAVEVGGYVMDSPDGQHVDHGKYIVIWKKVDGQWRLHRDIANSSMAPQQ